MNVALLPHGGFEDTSAWSSSTGALQLETQTVIDGAGAIRMTPNGYTLVTSDTFSTADIRELSNKLSIDVYLSEPQPNPWWGGDIQLFASCPSAGLYNQWVGYASLTNLFMEEFNQVEFTLPSSVIHAWSGQHSDCTVSVAVNVSQGSGVLILDRLGFL